MPTSGSWAGSLDAVRLVRRRARPTAMAKHLGLLITFSQQHDSSMPAPVSKVVRTLNPGIQFVF